MRTRTEIIDRILEIREEFTADRRGLYNDRIVREHITLCWVLGGTTAQHFMQQEPWNIDNLTNTYEDFSEPESEETPEPYDGIMWGDDD